MLDGNKTTFDWQADNCDICVLPVGSVEQHAAHLPVLTDVILADYFGRMIAEDLKSALLPTFPYGTCLEHSAFRGSFSLRPETQMQIVRDLADSVESQNFRFLVILNSHGGNFSLSPPARDINRTNRPLKIIIINWWEFCDSEFSIAAIGGGKEVHAGAWETSVMMAICPELVGTDRRDMKIDATELFPMTQRDLNTFGSGHLSASGAIGFPSQAKAAIGHGAIASIRKNMIPYIRDRIEQLRKNPTY